MKRLDLLTKLPSRLSCIILQDWLSLKFVVALDSAYCCHTHRVMFTDLVRSDEYFVREAFTITFKSAILNGLHRYGEKLRNVVFAGELTPQQEKLVVTHCCNCTHVRFLSDRAYYGALQNISSNKVVWLDLSGTFLSLLRIAGLCPCLKTLGLASIDLTDMLLYDIAESCHQIVHLDIRNNDRLTDWGILKVVTNLKSLRGLNVEGCTSLTDASLVHIYTHCAGTLHTLQLNCRKVEDFMLIFSVPLFSIPTICELLARCTQLRTLHLGRRVPTGNGITKINFPVSAFRNLTTLVLGQYICVDKMDASRHNSSYKLETLTFDFAFPKDALLSFAACRDCIYLNELNLVTGFCVNKDKIAFAEAASKLTDALKAFRPGLVVVHYINFWQDYSKHDVMNM